MTIQWFPGHMAKARRQIEEKLKLIDVVFELLDARLPLSSRNPMIDQILQKKPRVVLLNKADLADPAITAKWVEIFKQHGHQALAIDAATGTRLGEIADAALGLMYKKRQADRDRGVNPRAVRGLIVGIPNVGKSTLINKLAGRQIALTGDRPGVTKQQQWIKTGHELELLDTPGILWPKFEDPQVGVRLAATGAIKDDILNIEDVAFQTIKLLIVRYPQQLTERYKLTTLPEDLDDPVQVVETMEAIGRLRGCLLSGGRIDLEKASMAILRDLRSGKLGRVTLELPDTD